MLAWILFAVTLATLIIVVILPMAPEDVCASCPDRCEVIFIEPVILPPESLPSLDRLRMN